MKTKTSKTTNYVLLFMLVILLTTLSSAETYNLGTIKKDSCIEIPQVCLSCSYLKINIQYPNKTFAVVNQDMALKNSSTGLWSYYFCNTSELGKYEISGVGDLDGTAVAFTNLYFYVTPSGDETNMALVTFYIFLLSLCLYLIYQSARLIIKHPITKDEISLYKIRKQSRVRFYFELLKQKMYIVGSFGVYLSLLLFLSILDMLFFEFNFELYTLVNSLIIILGYGLIPFVIFWGVYLLLYFYINTEKILKYQLGGYETLMRRR